MPNPLAIRHLLIRLRPLNRALRAAVERQAAEAAQLDRPDLVPYCITDQQVAALLDRLDALPLPDSADAASLDSRGTGRRTARYASRPRPPA